MSRADIPHQADRQPNGDRTVRHRLRVRSLLLLIFGLLTLIAAAALTWNALHVYKDYRQAGQMAGANAVGQQSLALNVYLARERGLTAALLANPVAMTEQSQAALDQLRAKSDGGVAKLKEQVEIYARLPTVHSVSRRVGLLPSRLRMARDQVDLSLSRGRVGYHYTEWIVAITSLIEEIAAINRVVTAPVDETDHAILYGSAVKEAFFNLSENAGRERALISAVVAQGRSFSDGEYEKLANFQYTRRMIEQQINDIVHFFPRTPEIDQARTEFRETYNREYQLLRNRVLTSSRSGQPYHVTAPEWFERATDAVNAIVGFSRAIDLHISDDIDLIKRRSQGTVAALFATLLLVLSIFFVAFVVTYRRILAPLKTLEDSANIIAGGDFSTTRQDISNDEFGDVARAFEVMREYLQHDRDRRQRAEYQLRKLYTAIEQSISSIVITDTRGVVEYVNPQFYRTTGFRPDEIIGHLFDLQGPVDNQSTSYSELLQTISKGQVWQGELLSRKKNGDLYWDLVSISPVRGSDGDIAHYICIQHDITERKALEQRLDFMAYHDELTDLPNRALLADRFRQLCTRAQRFNSKVTLLMLDLDRFKLINDTLGHRIGDQLLVEVARRLKQAARGSDTVARYGGDEFVVLANDFTDNEIPVDLARRLVAAIEEPVTIEGYPLHISASIGISLWPDDGEDMETLLRQADTAMYHAKEQGRGQFQFFTSELNQRVSQRLRLETDLRKAIENREFEVHFQPQVDLPSGRIVGAEALVRWNHPQLGLVPPDQFIPLAEDTNLIIPIGEWVMQTAIRQQVAWHQAGHRLMMAVNVSVRQLDHADFIPRLTSLLEEGGISPDDLEIEITESSVMGQPDKMLFVLNSIKSLGISLALDDFGTGYSSLSYLRRFPFDKLKIDRSFVRDIVNKPEDAAIIKTIVEIAHNLDMTVLAEGVETRQQAGHMRHSACDFIQGFLVSKPVPADQFLGLLQSSREQSGVGSRVGRLAWNTD
ncbi:MAG: EAL domain-containing protein [Sedimenticola sp.]|nr:EAL domain-containing protein [Sedimenticola sp.]